MTYEYIHKKVTDPYINILLSKIPPLDLTNGPWIAGGSARLLWHNMPYISHDIDVFFANDTQYNNFVIALNKLNATISYESNNATTFDLPVSGVIFKVQLIKKEWCQNLFDIFNNFDFTCCQFATDGKTIVSTKDAIVDCQNKILRFNSRATKVLDSRRVIKYSFYGFTPDKNILKKIIALSNENTLSQGWGDAEY